MPRILLSSKSERRLEWLEQNISSFAVEVDVRPLLASEFNAPQGLEVRNQVEEVCRHKAINACIEQVISEREGGKSFDLILVSDTMIEDPDDDRLSIGKPEDILGAASILLRLSGRRHRVWSSTSILFPPGTAYEGEAIEGGWKAQSYTNSATVEFSELDDISIDELVRSGSWKGKAGGYDLAGMARKYCNVIDGEEVTVLGISSDAVGMLNLILSDKGDFSKL